MQLINLNYNQCDFKVLLRDEVDQSVFNEIFKIEEYRCAIDKIKQAKAPILDIGAHIGLFSLYCRALNPNVFIYAFEPEENNFKALEKINIDNNLRINLIRAAIGEKSGEGELVIAADNHNHHLAEQEAAPEQKFQKVKIYNLSDWRQANKITEIGLLKMDIEGGEYQIIDSLSIDDFKIIEAMVLEYHNDNWRDYRLIEEKLRSNGFSVKIFPSQFDKKMGFLWAINKR
ncbi:MAG: FkbM family methyltransferase [Patescibacteria group bacterium]|nr:FkbM family methyltransferase [Patescibacteria group bacterium]MDD5121463.1 FkbM family methyltransferase [Patescibacteria group bacterium]MDD5222025.1 FkbM family methyltransferase [Patescibacteria group bacterium]MDD5396375.1 FkbM family methyltransferase [Patescibacteria group bacterium]